MFSRYTRLIIHFQSQINFENVASRVGIGYSKNARSAFKTLMGKLQAGAPGLAGSTNGNDEDSVKPSPKKRAPRKIIGKGGDAPKKAAGKKAGPRKAAASKKGAAKKSEVKAVSEDEDEEEMMNEENDGKSSPLSDLSDIPNPFSDDEKEKKVKVNASSSENGEVAAKQPEVGRPIPDLEEWKANPMGLTFEEYQEAFAEEAMMDPPTPPPSNWDAIDEFLVEENTAALKIEA